MAVYLHLVRAAGDPLATSNQAKREKTGVRDSMALWRKALLKEPTEVWTDRILAYLASVPR